MAAVHGWRQTRQCVMRTSASAAPVRERTPDGGTVSDAPESAARQSQPASCREGRATVSSRHLPHHRRAPGPARSGHPPASCPPAGAAPTWPVVPVVRTGIVRTAPVSARHRCRSARNPPSRLTPEAGAAAVKSDHLSCRRPCRQPPAKSSQASLSDKTGKKSQLGGSFQT